jgi:oligopeptide/dipeptide ABC transporter ATP-binding protein
MTPALLEVEDLNVWFDLPNGGTLHAVRGVSFSVASGTRLGMVGESGCGKTTTILALMGLLPPTAAVSGRIMLDGADLLARGEQTISPHRWKDIAMVFQGAMNAFDPVKRIGEQIVEPMELHGVASGKEAAARVRELLATVGIPPGRARSYPHELSGGMRQRGAIAMALACNPRILLADEPTTALDVMVQAQILELLTRLSDELGLALVFVTHDLPIVAQTCTHAAVMYAGKIVEFGPTDALYHATRHPYTRLLWAATPDLESRDDIVSIPGVPPRLDSEIEGCPFAPRCDRAEARCVAERPELRTVGSEGHVSACHFAESLRVVA